jgi:hypothetical protein
MLKAFSKKDRIWRFIRPFIGWFCILLGCLGLFLPFIQGILFLVLGIALVGPENRFLCWIGLQLNRFLQGWAALQIPIIGEVGRWVWRIHQNLARQIKTFSKKEME